MAKPLSLPLKIKLDAGQLELVNSLKDTQKTFFKTKGIYIYGDVGSGKTTIAKGFFDTLKGKKLFYHFAELMRFIHLSLHSEGALLENVLQKLTKDLDAIFIDEFEIHDPADASLIFNTLEYLYKKNIIVILTSNVKPDNLTLADESILIPLKSLLQKYKILFLASEKDYRFSMASSGRRILFPFTEKANFNQEVSKLIYGIQMLSRTIEVYGRKIEFKRCYNDILYTDFEEICGEARSKAEYIEICSIFKRIIIFDVPIINDNNKMLRFVNLIDQMYLKKVILFAILETEPKNLFPASGFRRTISRLQEMNSNNYGS